MTMYPQGGQRCMCGAELQQLGEGEHFEIPLRQVSAGKGTARHEAGIEVEVFRCPTCRRIEFFQVGGGPEATVRYGS